MTFSQTTGLFFSPIATVIDELSTHHGIIGFATQFIDFRCKLMSVLSFYSVTTSSGVYLLFIIKQIKETDLPSVMHVRHQKYHQTLIVFWDILSCKYNIEIQQISQNHIVFVFCDIFRQQYNYMNTIRRQNSLEILYGYGSRTKNTKVVLQKYRAHYRDLMRFQQDLF